MADAPWFTGASAEALEDVDPPRPGMSREVIRITPRWIFSWGL